MLVLPIHGSEVKSTVSALLDSLHTGGWKTGTPLPPG
jgi:hypothetical protein